jgi:phospholipase/carboxylesterase
MNEPILIDSGPILHETGLVHKVLEPPGPGPYRALVMLHGRFGNEDVMWIFRNAAPVHWLKVAPRAIVDEGDGRYSWVRQPYGTWPDLPAFDEAVTAVTNFLLALPRVYNADPDQLYLMGFSQGAAVSYATALSHPGIVRAIAGLVGFLPGGCGDRGDLEGLRRLPVYMAVGRDDPLVPYERALGCAETLLQADAELSYHDYATGHKLNRQGMDDLQSWFLALK